MSDVLGLAALVVGHGAFVVGVARWARGPGPTPAQWRRYRRAVRARERALRRDRPPPGP